MITVIIPTRNELRYIGPALGSLQSQHWPSTWEAIVADGMSDDGTREILDRYHCRDPRIRMIDNPGGIVSTGLNQAIREAHGDVILRMDAHTTYAPDYVAQCLKALEASGADNVGGPARTTASGIMQRAIAAAYHSPFSTGGTKFHYEHYEGYVDTVPYGCWRKATLERIGMFDEALVRNQDDELNLRLIRLGGKIWQSPKIISWYQPRNTLAALFGQYFQYGFWKIAVIRKHRLPASWRHLVPGTFVFGNIGLLAGAGITGAIVLLKVWIVAAALYAVLSFAASVLAARKNGWELLPILPVVFAVYHASYGIGFLANALYYSVARSGALQPGRAFTSVTRL